MMSVCTSWCQPWLPRACVSLSSLVILLSSNNPASIPKIPIKRCPPPSLPNIDLLHHPRPFLNSGKTESPQVAELQPTPVCTVQQALSSCFLPLGLALCLPPQFLHPGLPALRVSVYPSSASENVFLPFFRLKPYSLFKSQFKGLF